MGTSGFTDVSLFKSCAPGLRHAQVSGGEKLGLCGALERAPKAGGAQGCFEGEELFCTGAVGGLRCVCSSPAHLGSALHALKGK